MDYEDIQAKIKEFENWLKKIRKEHEGLEKAEQLDGIFKKRFLSFLNELELISCTHYDDILSEKDSLAETIKRTCLVFGENPTKFKIEQFFACFDAFISKFKATCL